MDFLPTASPSRCCLLLLLPLCRALALIHRSWESDAMAALRDCEAAIELEPGSMKAHYRRVQALAACKLYKVHSCLPLFVHCLLTVSSPCAPFSNRHSLMYCVFEDCLRAGPPARCVCVRAVGCCCGAHLPAAVPRGRWRGAGAAGGPDYSGPGAARAARGNAAPAGGEPAPGAAAAREYFCC